MRRNRTVTETAFSGIFELELRREIVFEHLQLSRKWLADLRSFADDSDADVAEALHRERTFTAYLRWIDEQIDTFVNRALVGLAIGHVPTADDDAGDRVGAGRLAPGAGGGAGGVHRHQQHPGAGAGEGDR